MSEHRLDLESASAWGWWRRFGAATSAEQIIAIARDFNAPVNWPWSPALMKRKPPVRTSIPELVHHRQARCLTLGELPNPSQPAVGLLCGGR